MIILPAIDIKDNKCVRLTQGDFNKVKTYSSDPLDIALSWQSQKAQYLHLVDLDGAKTASFTNDKSIKRILKEIKIPVQIGGGIRSIERVSELLELGASRVILGTAAIENLELVGKLLSLYGSEKILVSVDAKDGKVATEGWLSVSQKDSLLFCKELEGIGIKTLVYTDIAKDGMLEGPSFEIYENLIKETKLNIIVSGGVSSLDDIKRLYKLDPYGVIIGKALYDGLLDLQEVLKWQE